MPILSFYFNQNSLSGDAKETNNYTDQLLVNLKKDIEEPESTVLTVSFNIIC